MSIEMTPLALKAICKGAGIALIAWGVAWAVIIAATSKRKK